VDSLTDQEVALIAGKLDQLPAPAGAYNSEAYLVAFWPIFLIAAGILIIIALILSVGDAVSDRNFPEKT
jgi:hypothetical protein